MIEIPLTRGYVALVDDEDAHLAKLKWCVLPPNRRNRSAYASRGVSLPDGRIRHVLLHREVMAAPEGVDVDHVNGNGLDCRRANLRLATAEQNTQNQGIRKNNRSGFKGVRWYAPLRKWAARIGAGRKRWHLGYFTTAKEAAAAYDEAALRLHGEFARTNAMIQGSEVSLG